MHIDPDSPVARLIGPRFTAVDIGARGDIPAHWLALDGLADIVAFDADPQACEALRRRYASRGHGERYRVEPVALGGANGERTLYLTRGRGGSSLFRPDTDAIRRYVNDDYCAVTDTLTLAIRHAGEVFREIGLVDVDLLKLDIQGAELEVLEALPGELLDTVLMVQTEVQFQDRGNGAPRFPAIDTYLTGHGFELYDLNLVHQHPTIQGNRVNSLRGFGVYQRSASINRRLWFGDALYLRRQVADPGKFSNLLTGLCLHGFFSEALALLHEAAAAGRIAADEQRRREQAILDWHRTRRRWWHGASPAARLYRRLLHRLGLRAQIRDH